MSLARKCLVFMVVAGTMFGTGAAAPAFEVLSGDLAMGGNNITGLDHVNGNDASQLSFLGNSIEQKDITNGTIRGKDLNDSIAGNCLNFATLPVGRVMELTQNCVDNGHLVDEAVNNQTINSGDGYTFGFVSLRTPLGTTNISDNAITRPKIKNSAINSDKIKSQGVRSSDIDQKSIVKEKIASGAVQGEAGSFRDHIKDNTVDDRDIVDGGIDNTSLNSSSGYTFGFVSFGTPLEAGNLSLGSGLADTGGDGTVDVDVTSAFTFSSGQLAHATGGVGSGAIAAGAVDTAELAAGAITETSHILDVASVNGTAVVDNTLGSSDISSGAITQSGGEIAADAVTGTAIAASAVDSAQLASGAVTTGKIASGAITETSHILDVGAVNDTAVKDGSLTGTDVSDGTIGSADLGSDAVDTTELVSNAVTDTEAVDSLTIGSTGKVAGAFVSAGTPLEAGNLSLGAGLKGTSSLTVEPADFAGAGLEDNSDKLRIASTAAGSGLAGGSGSALSINVGDGIQISTDTLQVDVSAIAANGLTTDGSSPANLQVQAADGTISVSSSGIDVASDGVGSAELASDAVTSSAVATGAIGGAEISNTNVINSSHTNLGNGLTDAGSDGSIDVQAADNTISVASGGISVNPGNIDHTSLAGLTSGDDHTQYLERDGTDTMAGNLAMAGNNVTNTHAINMTTGAAVQSGDPCNSAEEGKIVYNGTHHLGCRNANTWETLY